MEIENVLIDKLSPTIPKLKLVKTTKPMAVKPIPLAKTDFPNQSDIEVKVLGYGANVNIIEEKQRFHR